MEKTQLKTDKKKQVHDDAKISKALMASFVILTIQYFILIYFNLIGTGAASTVQLISKILVAGMYAYAFPVIFKRSKIKFLAIYFLSVFVFLANYLLFPKNHFYIGSIFFDFFFMCIPSLIYSLSIEDLNIFKYTMRKSAQVIFVFGTLIAGLVFSGATSIGAYSMALSYYMLLPLIIYLDEFIDKLTYRSLFLVIISLTIILSLGSRGAVLCIMVFAFVKIIKPNTQYTFKRVAGYSAAFSTLVLVYIFLEQIIMNLYNFLLNFGINSRSLLLFLRDDIHLSGRDEIYKNVVSELFNSPFLGIGLAGDRYVRDGSYVHNVFLEILANFGIVLGAFIVAALCIMVMKLIFDRNLERYSLFIIWLNLGFTHLMVSSSYLTDIKFWVFLGVSINLLVKSKNEQHRDHQELRGLTMKIGTVTFHCSNNYGAVLQSIALIEKLNNLGHDAKIVDYRPKYKTEPYNPFIIKKSFKSFKHFLYHVYSIPTKYKVEKEFQKFNKKHMKTWENKYYSDKELESNAPQVNVLITGSDQVWNPESLQAVDKAYFLGFGGNEIKRISYAPSFGTSNVEEKFWPEIIKYINNLDAISVREVEGKELIRKMTGKEATHVLDPVFLLGKDEWHKFEDSTFSINEPYVLLYARERNKLLSDTAYKIAKERNLKVVNISKIMVGLNKYDKNLFNIGPGHFLELFKNASVICTNSFHGTAFSIIYEKPFVVIPHRTRNTRIDSILSLLELSQQQITGQEVFNCKSIEEIINYDKDNTKQLLKLEKNKSIQFLENALKH